MFIKKISTAGVILHLLIISVFVRELVSHRSQSPGYHRKHVRRELDSGGRDINHSSMTLEAQNNSVIVAQAGGTATIRCYSLYMGDDHDLVIWMKKDDERLLTAGQQVYSSEHRYSVSHVRHQQLWELSIRKIDFKDAGTYECQLTSHPPLALHFHLKVVQAKAVIRGPKELHVEEGSKLSLQCMVEEATEPLLYVFWFHNSSMLNHNPKRLTNITNDEKKHTSTLSIDDVRRSDAGEYRCDPHLATSANVTIHVLAGENPAAMQRGRDGNIRLVEQDANDGAGASPSTSSSTRSGGYPNILLYPSIFYFITCLVDSFKLTIFSSMSVTNLLGSFNGKEV